MLQKGKQTVINSTLLPGMKSDATVDWVINSTLKPGMKSCASEE